MRPIKVTAYRGQHGTRDTGVLQTKLPSITFSTLEAAIVYAESPNDSSDAAMDPHVLVADLVIKKPLPITPEDPFIDVTLVMDVMGPEAGKNFCLEHAEWIVETNNWQENFEDDFDSVKDVFDQAPKRIEELYFYAYIALDNADFINATLAKGYDGCAHGGSGESALMVEYKVFRPELAQIRSVLDISDARDLHKKMRQEAVLAATPSQVPCMSM